MSEAEEVVKFYQQLLERDLTNYLNAIAYNLDLMGKVVAKGSGESQALADRLTKPYEKARDATNGALAIVSEASKLQRVRMWDNEVLEVLDLKELVQGAIDFLSQIHYKVINDGLLGFNFEVEDPSRHYPVKANDLLDDIFITLIGNAIRHSSREEKVIDFALAEGGETMWKVTVEDPGLVISPEQKDKVFKRFSYSLDQPLGLSLAFELTTKMGGSIKVEYLGDDPSEGTRFVVKFPKALQDSET